MDGFSPTILKLCINTIIEPLLYIINLSLKTGVFPNKLKVAKVIPVHKTGDTSNVNNKRPVSILNCLSKVFEKVIFNRINEYLDMYKIINVSQHGFRKNRSTETAIADFLKVAYQDINLKKIGIGIFIDYSKAFDCIDYDIFVKKLEHIGIRGAMKNLLADYLRGRTQCVFYNNCYSDPIELRQGAPQGSNLAPLIWQIYGNDMVNCTNSLVFSLFADDTNTYKSHTKIVNLIHDANRELLKLYQWIIDNRLSMNVKKLNGLLFNYRGRTDNLPNIMIGQSIIPLVDSTKFLGIIVDKGLKWEEHIKSVANKISKLSGIIYLIRRSLTPEALKCIYFSLGYSHIIYGIVFWGDSHACHLRPLVVAHKRLVRTICFANRMDHALELFNNLKLLNFKNIYTYFALLFAFKCLNFSYVSNIYVPINHNYNTRFADLNMSLPPVARTSVVSKSFVYKVPRIWNDLTNELKRENRFDTFKRKLKNHLLSNQLLE